MTTHKELRQDLAYWKQVLDRGPEHKLHETAKARIETLTKQLTPPLKIEESS